jgi:hypothetical protein
MAYGNIIWFSPQYCREEIRLAETKRKSRKSRPGD